MNLRDGSVVPNTVSEAIKDTEIGKFKKALRSIRLFSLVDQHRKSMRNSNKMIRLKS